MQDNNDKIYTITEIADKLRVHYRSVTRWLKTGLLQCTRINRRGHARISQAQLDDYLARMN